jgi:signal transduction histidine kinase/CheY-like chemotaxis protein
MDPNAEGVGRIAGVLRRVHSITSAPELSFADKLRALLEVGCAHYALSIGIVSHVENGQYEVVAAVAPEDRISVGAQFPLAKTYCSETLAFGGTIYFEDVEKTKYKTHPCYLEFGLAAYIGVPILVGNEVYGTLNFSSPSAREGEFCVADTEVIKLMAQWVGREIERQRIANALLEADQIHQHAQRVHLVGHLVGEIAHDFNNILMGIMGFSEIARHDVGANDRAGESMHECFLGAKRGARLTRRLLDYMRRDTEDEHLLELDPVVRSIARFMGSLLSSQVNLTVSLRAPGRCVRASTSQIDQVLMNLVVNARDAMPAGGTVNIETFVGGDDNAISPWVTIQVSDTGIGMDDEVRRRALTQYFTTKGAGAGTGLGLSTVQSIAERLGGKLSLASEPGIGTTVSICLPVSEEQVVNQGPEERPAAARTGGVVLLVESEHRIRKTVTRHLESLGCQVIEATDGEAGKEIWARRGAEIDVLISDLVMPGDPAWDLAHKVCSEARHVHILFMSAYPRAFLREHRHIALEFDIIEKPFSRAQLAKHLGRAK